MAISFDQIRQAFSPRQPLNKDEDIFKKAARKVITDLFGVGKSEDVLTAKSKRFLRSNQPKAVSLRQQFPNIKTDIDVAPVRSVDDDNLSPGRQVFRKIALSTPVGYGVDKLFDLYQKVNKEKAGEASMKAGHFTAGFSNVVPFVPVEKLTLGEELPDRDKYAAYRAAGGAAGTVALTLATGGAASPAAFAKGLAKTTAMGGGVGGAITIGEKLISEGRMPTREELTLGVGMGGLRALEQSPTLKLTNIVVDRAAESLPIFRGITDKAINDALPKGGESIKEFVMKIGDSAVRRQLKSLLIESPYEAAQYGIKNVEEGEQVIDSIVQEFKDNVIWNALYSGAGTLGDTLTVRDAFRVALEDSPTYQKVTEAMKDERGFIAFRSDSGDVPKVEGGAYGPGKYYSLSKDILEQEGYKDINQVEVPDFKNPLEIKDQSDLERYVFHADEKGQTLTEWAKAEGYDGVIDRPGDTAIALNEPKVIKTVKDLQAQYQERKALKEQGKTKLSEIEGNIATAQAGGLEKAQSLQEIRSGFSDSDIKEINRLKNATKLNRKLSSGDIETARQLKPELTNKILERVMEVTGIVDDEEAFEFIKTFPSLQEIKAAGKPDVSSLLAEQAAVKKEFGIKDVKDDSGRQVIKMQGGKFVHEGEEPFRVTFSKYVDMGDKEAKEGLRKYLTENIDDLQVQRRGKISDEQLTELAKETNLTVDDIKNRKPGTLMSPEEIVRATEIVKDQNKYIGELSKEIDSFVQRGETPPKDLELELIRETELSNVLKQNLFGNASEQGRAFRALQDLNKAIKESDPNAPFEEVIRKWFGDTEKADEYIEKLRTLPDALSRQKFMQKVGPKTLIGKIEEYWYNSVLSSPTTHAINMLSNTVSTALRVPEKELAGGIDALLTKAGNIFGKNLERDRFAGEGLIEFHGVKTGMSNGVRRALHVLRQGFREGDVETKLSAEDMPRVQQIGGKVGTAINIPSRSLVAADEMMKAVNYDMGIQSLALREAKKSGLSGRDMAERYAELVSNPTDEMIEQALKEAKYRVFQEESEFARGAAEFRNKISVDLGGRIGKFTPLRFVVPFIQTPVKVVGYGIERSPLGLVKVGQKVLSGAPKGEVADQMARATLGSLLTVPLAWYATQNGITAGAPEDAKERDAFYADGKQPWSIKIGDQWVQYNRIEPLNAVLSQIAVWNDEFKNGGDAPTEDKIVRMGLQMVKNMSDQTFFQSIGDLLDALDDPENKSQRFLGTIASGFVPSIVRTAGRSLDRTVRDPGTIGEVVKSSIPGLSQTVPAKESEFQEGGVATRQSSVLSELLGIRASKDQGTNLQEQVLEVKQFKEQASERQKVETETAEKILAEFNASPENRKEIARRYYQEGVLTEDIAERIVNLAEADEMSLNGVDRYVKSLPVVERAGYIVDKTAGMSPEEKRAYFKELATKKILTEDVANMIVQYQQGDINQRAREQILRR